jgi:dipeptidyl aminopeptidase/acylaminoacyl peptidase
MRPVIEKTARALTLAILLLCSPARAADDHGRPYTIDDLLDQAAFGRASLDPTGQWVVFERQAPYSAIRRYDLGLFTRASTSVLWIADAGAASPASPLLAASEGVGLLQGDWSPSGRRLVVFRLTGDDWSLGVVDIETRAVRWLDVRPDAGGYGRVVQWVSEDVLVLFDRKAPGLPFVIGWDVGAMAQTEARWNLQAAGREPTLSRMGAGRFAEEVPSSPQVDLVRLDLATGRKTVLATDRFFDLELSPDRRWVAAMAYGAQPPVDQTRPLSPVSKPELRHAHIYSLDARAGVRADAPVAPFLMEWSADSRRLLLWLKGPHGPASGELAALRTDGALETFNRFGLEPDVGATRVSDFTAIRAVWQGDRPVLRGRRGQDRFDWHRLEPQTAVNLTRALDAVPGRIDAILGRDLIGVAGGAIWRLGPNRSTRLSSGQPPVEPFMPLGVLDAPRLRFNAPTRDGAYAVIQPTGRLRPGGPGSANPREPVVPPVVSGETVTPLAFGAGRVVEEVVRGGVRSLVLRRSDGGSRVLATLNGGLAEVRFSPPLPITHSGPAGEALVSWLYLPTVAVEGRIPLVVLAYPGRPSRPQADPAEFVTELNVQLLTAAGYAVLTPSVPRPFAPAEPGAGLADQILAVADAALLQHAELDPERLIYWGHSFGGYSGLVVATQTDRFKTIIVQGSVSNLAQKWGEFAPWTRADPRWGTSMRPEAGWAEASQGAMGGPPWTDPDRYVRNSPLFQADRIRTPILIMHGDRDMGLGQAESLFTALWRQNKDVRFLTWWGEAHTLESAANIREMYRQILLWLEETAPPAFSRSPTALTTSGATPRPPPSR